ncbi:germination protein YpeB [Salimicrobium halophilum]|uniref:Spore germination protein n=1 Tax=Salimicrobium halophilum TaxID=86666 RepID=A0A1G8PZB1_9BACI|nr:germination protein YpeB [Salimicrobium halophilum]SDI97801.1 spore germination protein [Salimicrobium halophilum]
MKKWIIPILITALLAVSFWGFNQYREKQAVLVQAENNYQRAFHELTYYIDLLNEKIGSALAMNSRASLSPQLAEIWKVTSEARADVGQLPLSLLPFNKTEEFLFDIGDFAYNAAVKDMDQEPLSEEEVKRLEQLFKQSKEIKTNLREVQNVVLNDHLRWMDVELQLATNEPGDNTIIDGFKTVESTVDGYDDSIVENDLDDEFSYITGEEVSEERAKEIGAKWLGDEEDLTVTSSKKGAKLHTFTVSFHQEDSGGYMDVSKKGGHILNLMKTRDIGEPELSLYQGGEKAAAYLEDLKFDNVEIVESSQFQRVGVYRFVYKKDEVRYYTDAIQVKVALDDGEMLGLTALEYMKNHGEDGMEAPAIDREEAKSMVNGNVEILEEHMAVINDEQGEKVLCYEFIGRRGDQTYRIFINADDGQEEKVEMMKRVEEQFTSSS